MSRPYCLALLVENELALPGDLQPVERAMMFVADLVLALEQGVAGQGSHRQRNPVETGGGIVGTADVIAKIVGIVGVNLDRSLYCTGRLARRSDISFIT